MTDATITTLFINGTAALLALGSWLQSWNNSRKSNKLLIKSDQIHDLTNARLTAMTAELAAAHLAIKTSDQRLADLQVVVTRMLAERVVVAPLVAADQEPVPVIIAGPNPVPIISVDAPTHIN